MSKIELQDSMINLAKSDLTEEIRFRFTRFLRKTYWNLYEQGELSEEAIKILSEICDVANDNSREKLVYYQYIEGALAMDTVKIYTSLRDFSIIGPFFSKMLISKIYFLYEVGHTFIEGCEETIRVFQNDFPITNEQVNVVISEVRENIDLFFAYIGQL